MAREEVEKRGGERKVGRSEQRETAPAQRCLPCTRALASTKADRRKLEILPLDFGSPKNRIRTVRIEFSHV